MHLVMVGGVFAAATGLTLGTEWPLWVDLAIWVWAFLFGLLNYVTGKAEDRDRIVALMTKPDGPGLYTRTVDWLLRILARMIMPKVRDGPLPEGLFARFFAYLDFEVADQKTATRLARDPFAWPVANVALKLAIIYPLLSLLIQWGVTDQDSGVAGQTILEGDVPWYWRAGVVVPLVCSVVAAILASATESRSLRADTQRLFLVVFVLAGAVAPAFAAAGAFATADVFAKLGFGLVVLTTVFAISASGTVAGVVTVALLVGLAIGSVAVFASGVTATLATTYVSAVTFAVAFMAAASGFLGRAVETGRGRIGYAVFWTLATTVLAGAVTLTPLSPSGQDGRPLIFALALLPLLNAAFDYLSYGTTLTLIRKGWFRQYGPSARVALLGVLDAGLAFVFLVGLGVTLVVVVGVINAHAIGGPLFDLPTVFGDLRDPEARGAYTWLILSCLTTLVPTIVHLLIVALSAFTWVPLRAKLWLARPVTTGRGELPVLGSTLAWSVMGLAYCAVVAAAVTGLLWLARGGIGDLGLIVLDCVDWLSTSLGAIPSA